MNTRTRLVYAALLLTGGLGLGGCAQITVTSNTLVNATARIADATTNAANATSDVTTDSANSVSARTHAARLKFVTADLVMLRREAAAGGGEHLRALAYMMHTQDQAAFARLLQQHYTQIFVADESPAQVLARVYAVAGVPPDMRHG